MLLQRTQVWFQYSQSSQLLLHLVLEYRLPLLTSAGTRHINGVDTDTQEKSHTHKINKSKKKLASTGCFAVFVDLNLTLTPSYPCPLLFLTVSYYSRVNCESVIYQDPTDGHPGLAGICVSHTQFLKEESPCRLKLSEECSGQVTLLGYSGGKKIQYRENMRQRPNTLLSIQGIVSRMLSDVQRDSLQNTAQKTESSDKSSLQKMRKARAPVWSKRPHEPLLTFSESQNKQPEIFSL